MIKSFTEKIYQELTGIKPGAFVLSPNEQARILDTAQKVRSKDYVFPVTIKNGVVSVIPDAITTARWFFMITGVATYWEIQGGEAPRVRVGWRPFVNETCFNTEPEYLDAVNPNLVFGREHLWNSYSQEYTHFEEYKNLYYSLAQRINLTVDVIPAYNTQDERGAVIVTGLEFFTGD